MMKSGKQSGSLLLNGNGVAYGFSDKPTVKQRVEMAKFHHQILGDVPMKLKKHGALVKPWES